MADKHKPKVPDTADDKEQSERFIETARTHGADEAMGKALNRALKRVARPKTPEPPPR